MELGYIDWWEFEPQGDTFIIKNLPDETKKATESGIFVSSETSVVQDRPFKGEVIAVGKDASFEVGDYVYFEPTAGMDLAMIRTVENEKYLLLYNKSVLGKRVKDTRG